MSELNLWASYVISGTSKDIFPCGARTLASLRMRCKCSRVFHKPTRTRQFGELISTSCAIADIHYASALA
eukprot:314388-Rhodomonas_salina.2